MMSRICTRLALLLLMPALLSACGFQLRGSAALPAQWQPLYVRSDSPNSELHQLLLRELELRGVALSRHADNARALLQISAVEDQQFTVSLDSDALAAEYALYQRANIHLLDGSGESLAGPQQIQVRRVIINDPNNPVGEESEHDLLKREMVRALALRIADQLGFWAPQLDTTP